MLEADSLLEEHPSPPPVMEHRTPVEVHKPLPACCYVVQVIND